MRKIAALAAVVIPSSYACVSYGEYDRRELALSEVHAARKSLARLSPVEPKSNTESKSTQKHLQNLNRFGATILAGSLSSEQVRQWNEKTLVAFSSPDERNVPMHGRIHCDVSIKSSKYNEDIARMGGEDSNGEKCNQDEFLPQLVRAYFAQRGGMPYKLTQLQFLNAKSGSVNQIWHRDNTAPGLTVLVALCDVRSNGPTELLLKSHGQEESLWAAFKGEVMEAFRSIGGEFLVSPAPCLLKRGRCRGVRLANSTPREGV